MVQVSRTCLLTPTTADCNAAPTIPGPLRVADTASPGAAWISKYTSVWNPGWVGSKDRVAVEVEDLAPGVLVGKPRAGVEAAKGVLVGVGIAAATRVGVGAENPLVLPPMALVGVGNVTRVASTTRVGVGAKNGVGVSTGVEATVTPLLVGVTNRVGVGRTNRVAVGGTARVGASVANWIRVGADTRVDVGNNGVSVEVGPEDTVGSGSSEVPQAMDAARTAAKTAISANLFFATLSLPVMAPS